MKQPELLKREQVRLQFDAGRTEPRFWVRRLVIWESPEKEPIQTIDLRPGLNIVWSPDPEDLEATDADEASGDEPAIGHGSGKTLFCRLLRYCLGEQRAASEVQRQNIANAMPSGLVGAEVVLDGQSWSVLRSLGGLSRDSCAKGKSLEELVAIPEDDRPYGLGAMLSAIEKAFIPSSVADMLPGSHPWLTTLAWLTRDQECRLTTVTEWRSSASDSESPARHLSELERHEVLRVLLNASDKTERTWRQEVACAVKTQEVRKRTAKYLTEFAVSRLRARLCRELGVEEDVLPDGRLAVQVLKDTAKARLATVLGARPANDVSDVSALRVQLKEATEMRSRLDGDRRVLEGKIPLREAELNTATSGAKSGISHITNKQNNPYCELCRVPVDLIRLKANCPGSEAPIDPKAIEERIAAYKAHVDDAQRVLNADKQALDRVRVEFAAAVLAEETLAEKLRREEAREREMREPLERARGFSREVDNLGELYDEIADTRASIQKTHKEVNSRRETLAAQQKKTASSLRRFSTLFDHFVRCVLGDSASGQVTLDGEGQFVCSVALGGDLSCTAINSLNVVGFDIAALCSGIEGKTHAPAFLVHDSPREGDLGPSVYNNLIRFMSSLEPTEGNAQFQYIITTTSKPPKELARRPWLVLRLAGSPAKKRLLKRDL